MRLSVLAVVATLMACDPDDAPPPAGPPGSVGVVLVVDGAAWPYGNDDYQVPQDCRATMGPCRIIKVRPGVRTPLASVLTDQLAPVGAAGSRGALVLLEREPRVVFEGDLAAMTGERLPPQRDQEGVAPGELGPALRVALDRLGSMPTRRKVLLIVARQYVPLPADLRGLGAQLTAAHVEVAAVSIDDGTIPLVYPDQWRTWRQLYPTLGGVRVLAVEPSDVPRVVGHWAAALRAGAPLTPPPPRPQPPPR